MDPQPDAAPRARRLTAAFLDPALEAEFQAEYFELVVRPATRFTWVVATWAFVAYGLHDALVLDRAIVRDALLLRYAVFVPVAIGVRVLSATREAYARFHAPAMLAYGMAANAVVLGIGAIAWPSPGFFIYTAYASLFVTLGPFVAKMNVVTQAAYTLLTGAVFLALCALVSHPPAVLVASIATSTLTLGGIGTFIAYKDQVQAREMFLQRRALTEERAKSDALLLNILPAAVADRLKAEERAIADGFGDVTVLFADLVGFTKLSERLTPEALVRGLNELFSQFDDLAEQLGVEKIKTIGDAYMAAAGLAGQRDHAATMAAMALAMIDRVEAFGARLGEPIAIRIGVNTGPVVAGVIGKKKFIYDVWGDTVNTASRMESHGVPGEVHVTEATKQALGGAFDFEARGPIDVKGKGAMHTWLLRRRAR
jgi:class 3 adenylate cyclase